jgi:hypothetical protein
VYTTYIPGEPPTQLKEISMFDFYKEFDKKWQDLAKQVKQVNDFWIDSIISSLKNFQK